MASALPNEVAALVARDFFCGAGWCGAGLAASRKAAESKIEVAARTRARGIGTPGNRGLGSGVREEDTGRGGTAQGDWRDVEADMWRGGAGLPGGAGGLERAAAGAADRSRDQRGGEADDVVERARGAGNRAVAGGRGLDRGRAPGGQRQRNRRGQLLSRRAARAAAHAQ